MTPIAFLPGMLIGGAASAGIPALMDLFTGASRKRKAALDAQMKMLDTEAQDLAVDIGESGTTSTQFKTGKALLDTSFSDAAKEADRMAAASGLGAEAQIGQRAKLNEAYTKGVRSILSDAEATRQQLKQRRRNVLLQKYGIELGEADAGLNAQNQIAGGMSSIISQLLLQGATTPETKKTTE